MYFDPRILQRLQILDRPVVGTIVANQQPPIDHRLRQDGFDRLSDVLHAVVTRHHQTDFCAHSRVALARLFAVRGSWNDSEISVVTPDNL